MFWYIVALLLGAAFLCLGGVFAYVAVKSRSGNLPFRSPLGLRGVEASDSPEKWAKAHYAVWPLFALGAAISFFHGVSLIPATLIADPNMNPAGYIAVLTIAGLVVMAALRILAEKAARASLDN